VAEASAAAAAGHQKGMNTCHPPVPKRWTTHSPQIDPCQLKLCMPSNPPAFRTRVLSIITEQLQNPMKSPAVLEYDTHHWALPIHAAISRIVDAAPPHFTVFLILGWGRIAGSYGLGALPVIRAPFQGAVQWRSLSWGVARRDYPRLLTIEPFRLKTAD
jgi:hypothetical protein